MSTITATDFIESIETQFADLGMTLEKVDNDLTWHYLYNNKHRASLSITFYVAANFISVKFRVETFSAELNENGLFDGTIWSGFDSVEQAIIQLLKAISEIKRESLTA